MRRIKNIDVVLVEVLWVLDKKMTLQNHSVTLSSGQKGSYKARFQDYNGKWSKIQTFIPLGGRLFLVFRDLTFDNILTKLERNYNIEIENTNAELGKKFSMQVFDMSK